jgi:hypothetical protein
MTAPKTSIRGLKRRAQRIKQDLRCQHLQALTLAAKEFGFENFPAARRALTEHESKMRRSYRVRYVDLLPPTLLKEISRRHIDCRLIRDAFAREFSKTESEIHYSHFFGCTQRGPNMTRSYLPLLSISDCTTVE